MRNKIFLLATMIIFTFTLHAGEMPSIYGLIRNDAIYSKSGGKHSFSDILENRIIIEKKPEQEIQAEAFENAANGSDDEGLDFTPAEEAPWKYFFDGRLYLMYGENGGLSYNSEFFEFRLMRAFIRYYSDIGDFTLGKTYISTGNAGLFNPFDTDKSVNFSDISYDREGLLALEHEFPLGELSSGKIYVRPDNPYSTSGGGFSLRLNAGGFDFGPAVARNSEDRNLAGLYFKGDLELGINGAYAAHFNDRAGDFYSEANCGIDYSFLSGRLVVDALFYYNESGASSPEDYSISPDSFLSARYYLYGGVKLIRDEFLSGGAACIANLDDGSLIILPSLSRLIAQRLSVTVQIPFIIGKNNEEFSSGTYGHFGILLRVEGKF